jgi:nitrogen-specific signal transduction histidine kinase
LLCGSAVLLVGSDVLERHWFPTLTTGWRHALLTTRAGIVTAAGSGIIYLIMRRYHLRLSHTAEQLSRLLEAYGTPNSSRQLFENPHLAHCRDVLGCTKRDCPMFNAPGTRCWQVMALGGGSGNGGAPPVTIQQCHECKVYRMSCPDGLTKLGESFNNLVFLLDQEADQVRLMRAQMVEKEKMVAIGQMAAGIAHEIGNPLSSISSIVQLIKRKGTAETAMGQLELIQGHIQRISATVRHLSTLARPISERWEFVDLGLALEEAVRLVSFDRRARNVRVLFEPPAGLPKTYALRGQMQQVFINILLNALDAMPEGGTLSVAAVQHGRHIVFTFEDTGYGIPEGAGRRIFEPFFTTKEPGRGTGLGLTVSYGIVQKHGGIIDFLSRDGRGTVFTVEIPVLHDKPEETGEANHHTLSRR